MIQDYTNKVAVVTGGAGDIGKAIAKQLLGDGAKVVISDVEQGALCLLYTSPSPRDQRGSRMPSSA